MCHFSDVTLSVGRHGKHPASKKSCLNESQNSEEVIIVTGCGSYWARKVVDRPPFTLVSQKCPAHTRLNSEGIYATRRWPRQLRGIADHASTNHCFSLHCCVSAEGGHFEHKL